MKSLFNINMSSPEAQRVFFDYVAEHKGENVDEVAREYKEISKQIIRREMDENAGKMTSYRFV